MLLPLLPLRAATLAFTGWLAAVPGPQGDGARAQIAAASTAAVAAATGEPVTITLYDENHREYATVRIGQDGSLDPQSATAIKRLLRCKRTDRKHAIAQPTLAMFANVALQWPGHTIDIISGYRAARKEPRSSYHRKGRAIDFRIRDVPLTTVRDYLWRTFRGVGVGYYPGSRFLHLDTRPGVSDTAWTFRHGKERYHPSWAESIRPAVETPAQPARHDRGKQHRPTRRAPARTHRGVGV